MPVAVGEFQAGALAVHHVGMGHEALDGFRGGVGEESEELRGVIRELVVHPDDLAVFHHHRDAFAESVEGGRDSRITGLGIFRDEIAGGPDEIGDHVRHAREEHLRGDPGGEHQAST